MGKYTAQDLKIMQAWPLERKIQVTQTRVLEWIEHWKAIGGGVYVSFSGGKDSTVLLDIVRHIDPTIPAVFIDTGLEYPEIREFALSQPNVTRIAPVRYNHVTHAYDFYPFNKVIEDWGYPVVSKEVSNAIMYARRGSQPCLYKMQGLDKDGNPSSFRRSFKRWAFLIDAPFKISDQCCMAMKKMPAKKYERESNRHGIVATTAEESRMRKTQWMRYGCNSFTGKRPISKPMSFWTEQDVLAYIKRFDLPYSPIYGDIIEEDGTLRCTGEQRTGCMFCMFGVQSESQPNKFQRMALTHPKQYDYCINKLGCGKVMDYIGIPYEPVDEDKISEQG